MSTKRIREALDLLQARHPEAFAAALLEVEAIERACKEACRNDVNHDLRKTDRGVDLGLLIELIAKDAP